MRRLSSESGFSSSRTCRGQPATFHRADLSGTPRRSGPTKNKYRRWSWACDAKMVFGSELARGLRFHEQGLNLVALLVSSGAWHLGQTTLSEKAHAQRRT